MLSLKSIIHHKPRLAFWTSWPFLHIGTIVFCSSSAHITMVLLLTTPPSIQPESASYTTTVITAPVRIKTEEPQIPTSDRTANLQLLLKHSVNSPKPAWQWVWILVAWQHFTQFPSSIETKKYSGLHQCSGSNLGEWLQRWHLKGACLKERVRRSCVWSIRTPSHSASITLTTTPPLNCGR